MIDKVDSFIRNLHKMCRKDDIATQRLIAGTITWADVPSDNDDILELEGWRAYEEVRNRAKNAYHRTIRSQKQPMQRATVKHPPLKPMERKPYHILKQEQTKHVLTQGRVTPVKEIVDVVVQPPVEYEKEEITFMTTQSLLDAQINPVTTQKIQPIEFQKEQLVTTQKEQPVEFQKEQLVTTQKEEPIITQKEETPIVPPIEIPSQITKRHSVETFKKKERAPTPILHQPTFIDLYLRPFLSYVPLLLLLVIVFSMK
jgi:hypothetical protein